ncbi:hypothetical protein DFH27DRAFT_388253 [Peziza echinospora]|nr:hypothetical protein DFH27DRAFT_388253 [Peziza echinospora]
MIQSITFSTLFSLLTLLILSSIPASHQLPQPAAPAPSAAVTFPLRAFTKTDVHCQILPSPGCITAPKFDFQIETDGIICGDVVVNKTKGYTGDKYYLKPNTRGELYRVSDNKKGYLAPISLPDVTGATKTYYAWKFQTPTLVPTTGVLSSDFATVGRDCGAMCGGTMLVYGFADTYAAKGRDFYVVPIEGTGNSIWRLIWKDDATAEPKGGYEVYLFAQ